ncbi:metal-dependent hydrolase [Vagococcus salmoninarum]|uniref:metal-dependent hydrolase n=1 Tax=Vagococcus salmoninarum TaxID=2739 RepID=UPI0018803BCB|nr:metal-dependent hydrolase [Vagococcus salmoninarum]MBE9388305.1 metal-dependent hydrolase [Vagococcus salmoninarum]
MKLSWHGQSCLQIITTEGTRILVDPFITGNDFSDLNAEKILADVIILTHAHNDHVGDTEAIAKRTGALIIANVELAAYFAKKGLKTHGMQPGGTYDFEFGRVKMTPAIHSSVYEDASGQLIPLGIAAGLLLMIDGVEIYHAGDTALFSDMQLIGQQHEIDYAFLPIGDNFTMGPTDAALATTWLKPKKVTPIHYNTFPIIAQDPQAFFQLIPEDQALPLAIGQVIEA